jgi:two-component system sensor histidine kinase UhpB
LIAAQETERTRIARDLHDDVSQRIAGLSIMISGVKRRLLGVPDQAEVLTELTSMQRHTIALAEEIRQVSHDLHPALLQHAGLGTALSAICAQFQKLHSTAVTYRIGDEVGAVDSDIALCLYRVTQEALRNVAKHAEAQQVWVTLTRDGEIVQLSIADDGKGFDLTGTRATGAGLGLVSIDERVRLLGGRVDIETQSGGGTRVEVKIPQRRQGPLKHDGAMHDPVVERSALKA